MSTKKKLPRGIAEHRGKYRVRIVHKGESVSLGVYTTLTHAKVALAIARADTGTSPQTARMCRPYKYKPHARNPTKTGSLLDFM